MTRARDVANLIGSGNYSSTTFTATAGQTVFSIAHTQNFVQVFMNGLLLDLTVDYTSNGSAVTLTSGAAAGDEIEVVAYNTFSVGDALNQAAADTRYVNTAGDTMTGDLGIGVAPAQPLHVFKAGSSGGGLVPLIKVQNDTNNTTGDGSGIEFHGKYQGGEWGFGKIGGTNSGSNFGGALEFHTNTGTGSVSTGFTKKMTIDRTGAVTMPYQPMFHGTAISSQSTTGNSNVSNPIQFASNTAPISSTHFNHTTHRFTAPVSGNYMVEWGYATNSPAGQSVWRTYIWKNGSRLDYSQLRNDSNGTTGYIMASRNALIPLSANDYIHLNSSCDAGHAFYADSGLRIHINIHLVG